MKELGYLSYNVDYYARASKNQLRIEPILHDVGSYGVKDTDT